MSSLDILQSIYKPYRYTINKGITIVESTSGKFVIKKQNKDLYSLFNYLTSRGFTNMPTLVRNYKNQENVFTYNEEDIIPKEQKLDNLASVIASLHNKTVYYKNTSIDNYKEIKELIEDNIHYMQIEYEALFLKICKEEYMSPSKYLFARNYYKIVQNLKYTEEKLNNWYSITQNNSKERVAVVHNNLAMDHYIYNENGGVLISWDNYKIDSPILDIVSLYQKEYLNYDFTCFFQKYLNTFNLLDSEKELLFILISLPPKIKEGNNEFNNTKYMKQYIDYIYKTEALIRPYNSKEDEK